ncbi:disulfide bond formation protein B [Aquicella lusitana]|uniref:Disulfide bond formation protein B n=1 Tax=Aquicella lusitana TaxID=254246 RepID=A0A370GS75_9COXI|nr:disulfide bond formation protein B [Aquicella lusitana]RDI46547.1 disulfide bond formation protein DsbB [Aquicella lusitana]VVC74211.1 Disulfide bond formation protein B [Aquicella lusitana]
MSSRLLYFLGFVIICFLLATGFYLQYVDGIMPCPLCMLQRFCFAGLGILFFIGFFVHAKPLARYTIDALSVLVSLLGILLAGRQIWLQHFSTAENSECGVSLQYMVQALPLHEVMQKIIAGSAECTQRGWEFLYLDMAEWSLIWFIFFLLLSLYLLLKKVK